MKILFLSNSNLNCNSGGHIVSLANALVDIGVECLVGVPNKADTILNGPSGKFKIMHADALIECIAKESPDLTHLWTPREGNRRFLDRLLERFNCPYLIHLEDNEFHLTQVAYGVDEFEFQNMFSGSSEQEVPDHLSDPKKLKALFEKTVGVSALIDELLELKPAQIPGIVFWPG